MDKMLKQLANETQQWTAKHGIDKLRNLAGSAGVDAENAALKDRWLKIFENLCAEPGGENLRAAAEIVKADTPYFKEAVGKAVYEGKVSDEDLYRILAGKMDAKMTASVSSCIGCVACSPCAVCGSCAACIISGVVLLASSAVSLSAASAATAAM